MKKLLSILLVLSLLLCSMLSLASCDLGEGKDDEDDKTAESMPTKTSALIKNLNKAGLEYDELDEEGLADFLETIGSEASITDVIECYAGNGQYFIIVFCDSKSDATDVKNAIAAFVEENAEEYENEEGFDLKNFELKKEGNLVWWGHKDIVKAAMTGKYSAKNPNGGGVGGGDVAITVPTDPDEIIALLNEAGCPMVDISDANETKQFTDRFYITADVTAVIMASLRNNHGAFIIFCSSNSEALKAQNDFHLTKNKYPELFDGIDCDGYRSEVKGNIFYWGHADVVNVAQGQKGITLGDGSSGGGGNADIAKRDPDYVYHLIIQAGCNNVDMTDDESQARNFLEGLGITADVETIIMAALSDGVGAYIFFCSSHDAAITMYDGLANAIKENPEDFGSMDPDDIIFEVNGCEVYWGYSDIIRVARGETGIDLGGIELPIIPVPPVSIPELDHVRSLDEIVNSGKLYVAVSPDFYPFAYKDDYGNLAGVEIDLISHVCASLGVDPIFVELPFDEMMTAIEYGKYDIAISGIAKVGDRPDKMIFTSPFYRGGVYTVSFLDNPYTFDDLTYTEGEKRVGYVSDQYSGIFNKCQAHHITAYDYESLDALLTAIYNGDVDAMILTEYDIHSIDQDVFTIERSLGGEERFCFAIPFGGRDLMEAINDIVHNAHLSGIYGVILSNHGLATDTLN